ncbi:2-succinyl-6-hydroxy-2,4-cyclohexadiene-1-carboxylate synthase [Bacillus kexueae]|uniref:2-succinyl-6-hydroxy-2, 4-cyclohexadiene-1-carboxylate synthase n=1 Tax=Aeribacillus kexueae TaxID=2078952 RepID=UPI001FAF908C|nr:2-succinyl-6-hydroxy-2,4-cyclohexadiene-1-carboxylate synthase [Bacillus kexueae]
MKKVIRDATYYIERKGSGEPLVLLHGFTGDHTTWKAVEDSLLNYELILIDILGHGQTSSPANYERYRMEEVVEDLRVLLEELALGAVHLLGYSMGGRLALSFAMTYPHKVKSLILESSSPGLRTEEERELRRKSDERLANEILENGIESFVDKWKDIPLFQSQKSLSAEIRNQIRKQRLQNNPIGLANSLRGMGTGFQPNYWKRLDELICPVYIICGEKDEKFCRIGKQMSEHLVHATFTIVPKVGHAVHVEDSRFFGKIVNEFIHFVTNNDRKRLQ